MGSQLFSTRSVIPATAYMHMSHEQQREKPRTHPVQSTFKAKYQTYPTTSSTLRARTQMQWTPETANGQSSWHQRLQCWSNVSYNINSQSIPTVEATKKLKDWPEWEASIENEFNIHKKLGTEELVTPPLNANIVGSHIFLCYKLGKDRSVNSQKIEVSCTGINPSRRDQLQWHLLSNCQVDGHMNNCCNSCQEWLGTQTNGHRHHIPECFSQREHLYASTQRIHGTQPGRQGYTPETSDLWTQTVRMWMVWRPHGCTHKLRLPKMQVKHTMFYWFNLDMTLLAIDMYNIIITSNSLRAIKQFQNTWAQGTA